MLRFKEGRHAMDRQVEKEMERGRGWDARRVLWTMQGTRHALARHGAELRVKGGGSLRD